MRKIITFILSSITLCGWTQNYDSYFTGNPVDSVAQPLGGTCLMGGATEDDNAMIWFLERASGGDVLVLRASGSDGYNDYLYNQLGVSVNSVETIVFNDQSAAQESYIHDKINGAEAIWFAGGDQWNYVSYWRDSPIDSLINKAISERSIVIGGTSAGMAILGGSYFTAENGTITSAQALSNPYHPNMTVDNTPFLEVPYLSGVITDTHYDNPDRKGRHLAFMTKMLEELGVFIPGPFGIACDEYTAVCIDENGIAHVFGEHPSYDDFAYFIQFNCEFFSDIMPSAEYYEPNEPITFNYDGYAFHVLKLPGTTNGSNTIDISEDWGWDDQTGGEWFYWSIDNGVLVESTASHPNCNVGLEENQNEKVKLYPNPTEDVVTIEVEDSEFYNIRIYDLYGKLVKSSDHLVGNKSLDVSFLEPGIYLIELESKSFFSSQQLIIR